MAAKKKLSLWKKIGPGLITGASDDDPSGIVTYSQAGAAYGLKTLWTALFTFPMMAAIQEMCARIGLVTSHGLASTIKSYYPRYVLYLMLLTTSPAIILNIGADIAGMGAVSNLLLPSVPAIWFSIAFSIVILAIIIYLPYKKITSVLKYLCLVLLVYLIIPFFSRQDWRQIMAATFIPTIRFDKGFISILVAILGTTISPYMFFWEASIEGEENHQKGKYEVVSRSTLNDMKTDVSFGMLFSNIVMYFIILTTATVLNGQGIKNIDTVEQAAGALKPFAGNAAYLLFAIGIIGTGLLSIPVLSGARGYVFAESFGWKSGLNNKFSEARSFYIIISLSLVLGLGLNYMGISPMKAMIYSAILYGLTAPVLIGIILHICNNKKIMGNYTNTKGSNILGVVTFLFMTMAAGALIWFQWF
ncbi:MAG TPA: Nramp family divalent metal transporter [Puia sp.]|nr:Nramp family divalent metal transporter [Puia sp.]